MDNQDNVNQEAPRELENGAHSALPLGSPVMLDGVEGSVEDDRTGNNSFSQSASLPAGDSSRSTSSNAGVDSAPDTTSSDEPTISTFNIPGLDLGSQSMEISSEQKDLEYRQQGTMDFEPSQNVRTDFGRLGPDGRTLLKRLDHDLHMSPGIMDYAPTQLRFALDSDGMPLQYRGSREYPVAQLPTDADMEALEAENPNVLKPCRRTREAEWRWQVQRRRTPVAPGSWLCYVGLCGDEPGEELDELEWPGVKAIDESRHPPKAESEHKPKAAKEESAAQLEFKKAAFDLITKETGGKLSRENAVLLAGFWGYVPSEHDKKRFLEKSGDVSLKDLTYWLTHSLLHPEDQNLKEIKAVFAAVDKTGLISEFAFKHLLTEYGEALTEAEVEDVITRTGARVRQPDGSVKINYNDFVEELWSQNRKLPLPTAYTQLGVATRSLPPMVESEVTHF